MPTLRLSRALRYAKAKDVELHKVRINVKRGSPLVTENVQGLSVDGFTRWYEVIGSFGL